MARLELDQRDPEGEDAFLSVEPRENVPCLHILVEEHGLCLTHLTIPVIRGREQFSLGICLHNPSSFSFYDHTLCGFLLSSLAVFANHKQYITDQT
jgi:hypothetical protein